MKKEHKLWIRRIAWVLFIIYIIILTYFLFFSESYGRTGNTGSYRYNLTPFKEIRRFIVYREQLGFYSVLVNVIGNIVAFAPFGFVLPIISQRNRRFLNVALLSLELTLTVETLQLLLKVGIFDVDDLLLNTVGGVLGYLCFALFWNLWKIHQRPKKQ